jgi:hypothetical protein
VLNKGFFRHHDIFFWKFQESSLRKYRDLATLVDVSILDIETFQYQSRTLVPAFMYLLIAIYIGKYSQEEVSENFYNTSIYLFQDESEFNEFFNKFLNVSFDFCLFDLLPTIQYASTFFNVNIRYELTKSAVQCYQENVIENNSY